jgi:hypothetical protein
MKVVLIRKLAECMDGVDVRDRHVGDVLDLEPEQAGVLMAERWAIPDRRRDDLRVVSSERRRASDAAGDDSAAEHSDAVTASGGRNLRRRA